MQNTVHACSMAVSVKMNSPLYSQAMSFIQCTINLHRRGSSSYQTPKAVVRRYRSFGDIILGEDENISYADLFIKECL